MKKKYNKSTYFIFPMLLIEFKKLKGYINTYILDINNPGFENHIFLVLDSAQIDELSISTAKDTSYFLIDYSVEGHFVFIYKVPSLFKEDYNKFKKGKYSKFSEDYKTIVCNHIPKYELDAQGCKVLSRTYYYLFPDEAARKALEVKLGITLDEDSELLSVPNLEEEAFLILK